MKMLFRAFCLWTALRFTDSSYTTEILRPAFEKTFRDSCTIEKYPFIGTFFKNLENPSDRFVHFVFHEHGLKNGGFGDRLAGLVSATAMALRFNRTLVIESGNGFDQLFRPHHPNATDYIDPITKKTVSHFNYGDWPSWTKYNANFSNNDATELDLFNCINIGGRQTATCGMDGGDVGQPIIKIRGNRAYLCKWELNENIVAHREMRALGVTNNTNLYEMSGCLLRLAMWPTEKMWDYVDKTMTDDANKIENKKRDRRTDIAGSNDIAMNTTVKHWDYQVGVHFRCGDRSYVNGAAADVICRHDENNVHPESDYMVYGTPLDVARCAKEVLHNITADGTFLPNDWHGHKNHRKSRRLQRKTPDNILFFIASDNHGSALQINSTVEWADTIISPHGCHIEMDSSIECSELTLGYW